MFLEPYVAVRLSGNGSDFRHAYGLVCCFYEREEIRVCLPDYLRTDQLCEAIRPSLKHAIYREGHATIWKSSAPYGIATITTESVMQHEITDIL